MTRTRTSGAAGAVEEGSSKSSLPGLAQGLYGARGMFELTVGQSSWLPPADVVPAGVGSRAVACELWRASLLHPSTLPVFVFALNFMYL